MRKLDKLLQKPSPEAAPPAAEAQPKPEPPKAEPETPPEKPTKPQPAGDANDELRRVLTKTKETKHGTDKAERRPFSLFDPGSW